ncbi:hypothetical protein K437DRAFT_162716 [Tilletiaria anomala UBC 951]|uniref:Fe2OG dioxygenase domain-containing protein n=1 Tax=Tilletiaria anomala (strain ATCC 24038 / CBS 436.72 / UBC 951) TaxID=1037660 RepID=A0A066WNZ2_TILAU|nr:uncharacterized protein K437DRAFT_162716 [Tilletiaria anomala UBC 951]KDN52724.1 hypothetical protein K437DRAFT_162716 [Tilletiaria anomala UBC 951]
MRGKKSSRAYDDAKCSTPSSVPFPSIFPKPLSTDSVDWLLPDQLCLVRNFLTAKECATFITACSQLTFIASPPPRKGEAHRTNDRFSFEDQAFAEKLWEAGLAQCCQGWVGSEAKVNGRTASGLNPNIRVYRYSPSQLFGAHYDDSVTDPKTGKKSEWTLLIYLSGIEDGIEGGETVFYKDHSRKGDSDREIVAPLERGSALLHRHGNACMLHEARPPRKGTKWVLRSDVMFG